SACGVRVVEPSHNLSTVTITAMADGKSGSATLLVVPTVHVARRMPSLFAGDTTLLTVSYTDNAGQPFVASPAVVWSTRTPAVAGVAAGVVTALTTGSSTIVA